jgi:hypothetical protein
MVVEVDDPGVQAQEFLSAFPPLESLLSSFLTPCRTVGLAWAEQRGWPRLPAVQ